MNKSTEEKAMIAIKELIRSVSNKKVTTAVFNVHYANDFNDEQTAWRHSWLNKWLVIGLTSCLICFITWTLAMALRFGIFNMDPKFVIVLLMTALCTIILALISAIGLASIGASPKIRKFI